MNDELELLSESVGGLLGGLLGEEPDRRAFDDGSIWQALEAAGMTLVGVPDVLGGSGGTLEQAAAVLRVAAAESAPVPLAETAWLAGWLLTQCGRHVPAGRLAAASDGDGTVTAERSAGSWRLRGHLRRVPWARQASSLVLRVQHGDGAVVAMVDPARVEIRHGRNLAGEPRDDVVLDDVALGTDDVVPAGPGVTDDAFRQRGAVARLVQMAGAAERVVEIVVRHVNEREQFGRPLGKFQAVQQHVARLAGEARVLDMTAQVARRALDDADDRAASGVAAAKATGSAAAGEVAAIAHQLLGAIGFTVEHRLHLNTTRLWAWRQEFGNERYWSDRLGRITLYGDAAPVWHQLAGA